ncbi:hypothetical protein niasHS_011252 [Heterodera schachtii]|uniref:CUB domain-containing protein n=1 Tax=Heterodera schachtii TaxID=97005 RepID=A0ABD2J005_HETSC
MPVSSSAAPSAFLWHCAVLLLFLCFAPSALFADSSYGYRKSASVAPLLPHCRCAAEETFAPALISGVFKSPGYPQNYCNNLNCHWNIMPLENSFVGAMLDFFETEHRFDVLEVYQTWWNGSDILTARQAVLHGTFDPRTMERQFFSSVGGGLQFRFISDNTDSDFHGFQLTFRRYSKDDRSNSPCPLPFHRASSQVQSLPVLSPNFHFDSSCIFSIDASSAVNLTIVRFRSSTLSIKIFETENFQVHSFRQRPLAKIEAGISPTLPISVVSRTQSLTVLLSTKQTPFSSGHFDSVLPGSAVYELQFAETQSPCACPASPLVVSRSRAVFTTSPGFPTEYCDSANCSMTVALEGPAQRDGGGAVEVLRMRIWHFQTEPDQDYVAVWDEDGRRKLFLSNEAVEIRHLTFDRPHFAFSFVTDHSIVDVGFNFSVTSYRKERGCVCPTLPGTLLDGRAHYEENSFDRRKCQFMDCFWHIEAPKSSDAYHRIVFKLNHTIARPSDFILISQGPQRERNPFKRKFGSMSAGIEVTTEFEGVEPITLWLHREPSQTEDNDQRTATDEDGGGGGSGPAVLVNFSYEWREACLCGADAEQLQADAVKWRPLRSPDYPLNYCRDMRCQWNLIAPEGFHLVLNITTFNTEADQDFLYIFEGNDTTQKHKEMLTGPHFGPTIVHSEQRAVSLLFVSDGSIQEEGFELWFLAEANPGTEVSMNSSGHFPKTLVFFLFLILASTGAIFLFTRSRRIGGIGTWDGFVTNPFNEQSFVRFFRRPNASPPFSFTTSSSSVNVSSLSNPFFNDTQ